MQLYPRVFSLGSPITPKIFQLTSTSHGHQWMTVLPGMLVFPSYHEKNASACKHAPWNLGKTSQEIRQTHGMIWHPIQYAVLYVWKQASSTWTLPRSGNMVCTLKEQKTLHNAAAFLQELRQQKPCLCAWKRCRNNPALPMALQTATERDEIPNQVEVAASTVYNPSQPNHRALTFANT